jgi:hypothetical protein
MMETITRIPHIVSVARIVVPFIEAFPCAVIVFRVRHGIISRILLLIILAHNVLILHRPELRVASGRQESNEPGSEKHRHPTNVTWFHSPILLICIIIKQL